MPEGSSNAFAPDPEYPGLTIGVRAVLEGLSADVVRYWEAGDQQESDETFQRLFSSLERLEGAAAEDGRRLVRRLMLGWPEELALAWAGALNGPTARTRPAAEIRQMRRGGEVRAGEGAWRPGGPGAALARCPAISLLQDESAEATLAYLPLLGQAGYIVKGWSHIIAGYPKVGKTELIFQVCHEWRGERVLYFTEEDRRLWRQRLALRGDKDVEHITFSFAMDVGAQAVVDTIVAGDETVVIVDTVRAVFRLRDETDNSEIARVLQPVIVACRERGRTLLLLHHVRKGGGEGTEGITGGHAFVGAVDVALSVVFGGGATRRIFGQGRLETIPDLWYERVDGEFVVRGAPGRPPLDAEDAERALGLLSDQWQTTTQVRAAWGEAAPSRRRLLTALNELVEQGLAERDPAQPREGATYRFRLAKT